ncbi:hypothetical protein SDC9_162242 [bioreactor metagenome]|uniref:Uncharacterized protein n=1 Tax=bioreactor metagenome TaxID=1076179 RepID=A0A645FS61_9ZZZZ
MAFPVDTATLRFFLSGHQTGKGRFAGAIRTDKADHFPFIDAEKSPVDDILIVPRILER